MRMGTSQYRYWEGPGEGVPRPLPVPGWLWMRSHLQYRYRDDPGVNSHPRYQYQADTSSAPLSGTGTRMTLGELVPVLGRFWGCPGEVTHRLPVPGVPCREEGQDMRALRSPGRSPVSTASARSMGRHRYRSVSENPRCRIRIGVRGCRQRCCGGRRDPPGPSRGTGSDSDRLFLEPGTGSIIPGTGRDPRECCSIHGDGTGADPGTSSGISPPLTILGTGADPAASPGTGSGISFL